MKSNTNLKEIIKDTEKDTKLLITGNSKRDQDILNFEIYKWEKIFEKYIASPIEIDLPVFEKILYNNDDYKSRLESNSDIYSKACFNFLTKNYGGLKSKISSNLNQLIFSMNNDYITAYLLYQMLYPDGSDWKNSFSFFDDGMNRILNQYQYKEQLSYAYFSFAKKIIITEDALSHRINKHFLDLLWTTKEKQIDDLNKWYLDFGINQHHRSTPFRILYIQSKFSNPNNNLYSAKIESDKIRSDADRRWVKSIGQEYLHILSQNPFLKTNQKLSSTIDPLFDPALLDTDELIRSLELKPLLYLENIFLKNGLGPNRSNIFFKAIQTSIDEKVDYYFVNQGLLDFYVVKIIDSNYQAHFNTRGMVERLKKQVLSYLNSNNIYSDEYIERIYDDLKDDTDIRMTKLERDEIMKKISNIIDN